MFNVWELEEGGMKEQKWVLKDAQGWYYTGELTYPGSLDLYEYIGSTDLVENATQFPSIHRAYRAAQRSSAKVCLWYAVPTPEEAD